MAGPDNVVVVGGGLAGAKTVEALRDQGYDGPIALLCQEDELPYERPPLSKDYLQGKASRTDPQVHDAAWYAESAVDLRLDCTATAVDAAVGSVALSDGSSLGYGALVLATGSSPRHIPLPGADASNVHYLRRIGDSDAIRATFGAGRRLVLIGAGWIGLEVAAAARLAGTEVTVLEAAPAPLYAVLGEEIAAVFATLHTEHGVDLRTGVSVEAIETDDGVATGVRLAGGTLLPADALVVGVVRRRIWTWPAAPASRSTTGCWWMPRSAAAIHGSGRSATSPRWHTRSCRPGSGSSIGRPR